MQLVQRKGRVCVTSSGACNTGGDTQAVMNDTHTLHNAAPHAHEASYTLHEAGKPRWAWTYQYMEMREV